MTSGWLQHTAATPELLADKLNADGTFFAHLNGVVVRAYEDFHPITADAYCAVRY